MLIYLMFIYVPVYVFSQLFLEYSELRLALCIVLLNCFLSIWCISACMYYGFFWVAAAGGFYGLADGSKGVPTRFWHYLVSFCATTSTNRLCISICWKFILYIHK